MVKHIRDVALYVKTGLHHPLCVGGVKGRKFAFAPYHSATCAKCVREWERLHPART